MATWDDIHASLLSNNVPDILIVIGGAMAVIIALTYFKNKDSVFYKFMVLIGLGTGILLAIISVDTYNSRDLATTVIALVTAFALIIRPFREVHFAVLLALLVGAVVYVLLAQLAGTDLDVLASGWPRAVVALLAAVLVFTLTNFLESVIKMFGKILNAWPILFILGLICLAEGICLLAGYGSVYNMIDEELLSSISEMVA